MLHVVLFQPEIPPNTGNVGRMCALTRTRLHLIHPLGYEINDRNLKRAGMDYWDKCDIHVWPSFDALREKAGDARFFYLTTKTQRAYWDEQFQHGDHLVFGRETRGLPESLLAANASRCLTIPQQPEARSLNLATAAGIVLYEAVRQLAQR